jgi:hypothetical protein
MTMKIRSSIAMIIFIPMIVTACSPPLQGQTTTIPLISPTSIADSNPTHQPIKPTASLTGDNLASSEDQMSFGFTNQTSTGNRLISGMGRLPSHSIIDIDLPGKPIWVVGAPSGIQSAWMVVIEDGQVLNYLAGEDGIKKLDSQPMPIPEEMPPLVKSTLGEISLVTVPDQNQSTTTHPIYLPHFKLKAFITQNGDLQLIDLNDEPIATLEVNALPDARLLFDEQERILLLSDPTDRYAHGVLGDDLEAGSITLVETQPIPRIETRISLPKNEVVEGISPIWVNVTGDSQKEIIVTVSDINSGAGIVIFDESGKCLAEGPKMGQPYRWRQQIGYRDLGPDGEKELVVVRTPHIGGVVEYYQYRDGEWIIAAEFPGITSHSLGSRNLDMAAIGDFDADGVNELLLPNPELNELVAIHRSPSGADEDWRLDIGGKLGTNLAGVTGQSGEIAIGAGRTDDVLRLWLH